jgi:pilus assembly protein CpaF
LHAALAQERAPLSAADKAQLIQDVSDDILGYGPIDRLLKDENITEVMVNGPDSVYVERGGKVEKTAANFVDDTHLRRIIDKIVGQVGRRIDESTPLCDARLPDGSRVNAVIHPLAIGGPFLTIRKFSKDPYQIDDLIRFGTLNAASARFLQAMVVGRLNIIVAGGTGTGKTTTLNVLSSFIPATSASSPSRTPRSSSSTRTTCSRSRPVRRTSRARVRSRSATSSRTASACAPTASSSVSVVRARPWTCSRP